MLDPKSLPQPDDSAELAPKPSSARMEANRRNTRRSTGPKNPSGKKNSSRNARKHNPPTSQGSLVASVSISNGTSVRTTLRRSRTGKPGEGIKRDVADSISGLKQFFGTNDQYASGELFRQVLSTIPNLDTNKLDDRAQCVLPILHGLAPKDTLEGLLAAQMVGVHQLSMSFLARAVLQDQTFEGTDANVNRANKLLRTFMAQMEALDRHRGKITQPMVVGNVNVADGGQAIVGPVNHPSPGKVSKDDEEKKAG
ncbi:MAG: hypothetical protein WA637_02200 [Terriglobales bacterium]